MRINHYDLGKQLSYLRQKGVLIICSENIVHNAGRTDWRNMDVTPYYWNLEFDHLVKSELDEKKFDSLINYSKLGEAAKLSIPTNEHYLPIIYSLGMVEKKEDITQLYQVYQFGSMSMRCFRIG